MDQVRRAEVRLGGAGVWQALHRNQWLWRKNPENLTEKAAARMAGIAEQSLRTAKAYQMRLVWQAIYRRPTAGAGAAPLWSVWPVGGTPSAQVPAALQGEGGGLGGVAFGRELGALEVGPDQRLHGGVEQRLQRDQTQGARLPLNHPPQCHALLHRWQAPPTLVLIPPKTAGNLLFRLKFVEQLAHRDVGF